MIKLFTNLLICADGKNNQALLSIIRQKLNNNAKA